MKTGSNVNTSGAAIVIRMLPLLLVLSGPAWAQEPSACVVQGALAFDNWTADEAGGSGLPGGVQSIEYIRCSSCHGWDRRGTDGGHARKTRTEDQPNAGAGDGDTRTRALATGSVTADQVLHAGIGRSFSEGRASWVPLSPTPTASNTAEHAQGYTLGNQHPDFSSGLSQQQVDCLVEFLNFAGGDADNYFTEINPDLDPVYYQPLESADPDAGEAFFEFKCEDCHTQTSVIAFFSEEGGPSHLSHIARWGIPDSEMTRAAMDDPTAADIADMMAWLIEVSNTGFMMNPGLSGTWWNGPDRNGEGLLIDVALSNGQLYTFATLYTYDSNGEQTWLIAQGVVNGNMVDLQVFITSGPSWGEGYNPADFVATPWGTGSLMFTSCEAGVMSLEPNAEMQALGFTALAYDLRRDLLESGIACPTPTSE